MCNEYKYIAVVFYLSFELTHLYMTLN